MKHQHLVILAAATLTVLAGCGDSSTAFDPPIGANSVNAVFFADPDGDAVEITDAAALGADIDGIFGGENAEPVPVNPGDTIGDVLDRAKSS